MTEVIATRFETQFQVVHAVPGRVRIRLLEKTPEDTDGDLNQTLDKVAQQLRKQKGISEVRNNSTANSLITSFDTSTLSLPELLKVLENLGISEASPALHPNGLTQSLQKMPTDFFGSVEEKPISLTDIDLDITGVAKTAIPLVSGMLVTGALGVEGIMALPIYMAVDAVTRAAIAQFETNNEEANSENGNGSASLSTPKTSVNQTSSAEHNSKSHLQLEVPYSLVHVTSERMRFRVRRVIDDSEYVQRLTALAEADARVTSIRINSTAASVIFNYSAGTYSETQMREHLVKLIQKAGDPNIIVDLKKSSASGQETEAETNPWFNLALPATTATLALLGGPFGLPIPPMLIGGTIALTAIPVAQRALDSIINEQRLNIDFLDFAAIAITTFQGHFISPAIMLVLIETGEAIREQTARSSKKQTLDLLDSLKQFVWVERNGHKQEISIHDVKPGDTVIVYPGDQIPVDGRILRGKALIDEQKLTGESMPVMRSLGQTVHASTLVREGQLYILTEHVGADTRAGQIIKVMQEAPVHDTRIENYAAKVADSAVLPTLILSGIVFGATGNLARAASVLTLDFATGIRVSVPTTVLAALTHAAKRGILIRSGRALEQLASVDAVVFDKTGTLTRGEAVVVNVVTVSDAIAPLRVLELAAAAEQRLTHPVAEAVVRYAQEKGAKVLPRGKWDYEIGLGVRAEIDGLNVLVGSDRFLNQEGIDTDTLYQKHPSLQSGSCSLIYVACENELFGVIAYRDLVRPESPQVIQSLRLAGVEIHMLTGDNKRTAAVVAQELGITPTNTHAEAFPEKKVAVVKGLHEQGKTVAFVGDGINDSPALAYADVSVSFGNGSDVARETADVVLMENNLSGLPEAIAIARQAMQLIHQNTAIVAVPNLSALVLAALVGIPPLAATLVNNGSAILAGLNGLRPLLGGNEDLNQLATSSEDSNPEEITEVTQTEVDTTSITISEHVESVVETITIEDEKEFAIAQARDAVAFVSNGKPVVSLVETIEITAENAIAVNGNGNGKIPQHRENGKVAVVSPPESENTESLTAKALAQRLNVSATTIGKRKSRVDFPAWTRSKDPHGIAWLYSKNSHLFMPA